MKTFALAALAATMLAAAGPAAAQDAGPIHVVAYVEVMPSAKNDGASLLKTYRDAIRKEDGNLRAETLRRIGQPNQFVVIESWKDRAAFDKHAKAPSATQLRDKLKAIQNAPYDERVHTGLSVGPAGGGRRAGGAAVYVVTHIDVIPPKKDDGTALVKQHGDDSRKEDGNLRFEILVQTNRPNHFSAVEIWRTRSAADAHGATARTRNFREVLAPMSGALYDERFYKAM